MSLRWRFALALAVLAAAATTAACLTSYLSTKDRLYSEIDNSLKETANALRQLPRAGGGDLDRLGRFGTQNNPILTRSDYRVQYLDSTGTIEALSPSSAAKLPVSTDDVAVATDITHDTIRRDASVDGVSYRIYTTHRTTPALGGKPGGTTDTLGAVQVARNLTETDRILASLRARYLVLGFVVSVLAAAAGWIIARRATRPLELLADAAARVTETGRLDASVGVERNDETGRLARDFNRMLAALAGSREQQQRLVQDAGHELRTPLTSLRTNVSMLRHYERLPADDLARTVDDVDSELRELTGLVNELIELATDERDEEPVEDVVLARIGERAAVRLARRASRQVTLDLDDSVVTGRQRAIERAVTNLLDNAAKFDTTRLPIELTIANATISVRDHGPGIAPADQPLVFERFYRSDEARSRPGSGLGLSIVRAVATAHGGGVFVRNHPDGGAIVGFTLAPLTTLDGEGDGSTDGVVAVSAPQVDHVPDVHEVRDTGVVDDHQAPIVG
jgi:two-component system sensor histidine kinase MprB